MADEVVIKFTGDGGSLLSTTKAIGGEVKTLGDLFDKLRNQGKNAYLENAKGATALSQALGTSFKNAREFATSIGLSGQAATQATQRLKELDGAGASLAVKYRTLRSEFGLTRQAFESLNATYNQNSKAQTQLAQTLGLTVGNARNLASGLGLSATQANEAVVRYRELSAVGATLAEKQRVLTQELGLTDSQFGKIRGTALATREGLTAIAATATGVAAALGAIGAKGIQVFTEFDAVIRQFAVISEGTPASVAKVTAEIERLGTTTTKAPKEVATLAVELSKAGFTSDQVAQSLGGVVLASQATGEDLARTGEVIGNVINQFGLAASDSNRIADLLVATSNKSAAGTADLGEALSYVGTQAKQSGQSLDDTLLALGQLANAGIKGSSAGTGLAEALRRLKLASANATTELTDLKTKGSKTAVAAFNKIDQAVRGANGELLPLPQILGTLKTALANVAPPEKDLINNALFGIQGGRVIQTLISGNAEQTNILAEGLKNSAGAAQKAGDALSQGPAAGLQRLKASSDVALQAIGGILAQGFLPLIDVSGKLLSTFINLPGPMKVTVVAIGSVAAALASAVAALTAYQLLNAKLIIEQTIASAGLLANTVAQGASTAATIAGTAAKAAYAVATTTVSAAQLKDAAVAGIRTVAESGLITALRTTTVSQGAALVATQAMAIARGVVTAATIAFTVATGQATAATAATAAASLGASPAIAALGASIGSLAASLAAVAIPLAALGAAVGLVALVKQTEAIADANNRLAETAAQADVVQQSSLKTQDKLAGAIKRANAAKAENRTQTAAEVEANKKLLSQADQQLAILKQQLEQSKAVPDAKAGAFGVGANEAEAQNNARDAQVKGIEATIASIERQKSALVAAAPAQKAAISEAKAAANAAAEQKTKLDELKKSIAAVGENFDVGAIDAGAAEAELNKIAEANKTNLAARKAAKDEVLKIRQSEISEVDKLLKQGEISEAQSIERLSKIQSGTGDKAAKKAAADAIVGIKKSQIDAEIALINAGEAAIGAAVANGTKGEALAEQELTALKIAEIEKRIAANLLEQASATGSGKQKLIAEQKKLSADLSKAKGDQAEADRKQELKDYDEKLSLLEASFATRKTSEEQYLKDKQALQTGQADKEIEQLQERQSKLSAADTQGQEAIAAKIADVQVKRAKIQEEAQARALTKLKENQDKALAIVQQSEQERLIAIQRGVNEGVLTQDKADQLKANSTRDRIAQELELARKAEAELAAIDGGNLSADNAKKLEAEKQQARQKTTALTLSLLEQERAAQEALRKEAIASIDRELATTLRRYDSELRGIAATRQARVLAIQEAELGAQRQAAALDLETRSLERQGSLLSAKANLQKAQSNAAEASGNIELDRTKRAIELRKQLDSGGGSDIERIAAAKELARLGIGAGQTQLQLLQRQQAQENALAATRKAALEAEQAQARASLDLEIRKNDLASQRQLIEAQIAQSKAQAAVIDAQLAAQEQKRSAARALAEAQAAKARAEQLAPGADRNQAIAAATDQIAAAKQQSTLGSQAAQFGIQAAQQQAQLATQNTAAVQAQIANQTEINALATQALAVEQQTAQAQFAAAESSRLSAQSLDQARVFSEQIAAAAEREAAARERSRGAGNGVTPIPRFAGGPVSPGNTYEMAEQGPEMVTFPGGGRSLITQRGLYTVPSAGHVHTASETRAMLSRSVPAANGSVSGGSSFGRGETSRPTSDPLLDEMRKTRRAIESRKQLPPANITVNSGDDREVDRTLRSIIRSRF